MTHTGISKSIFRIQTISLVRIWFKSRRSHYLLVYCWRTLCQDTKPFKSFIWIIWFWESLKEIIIKIELINITQDSSRKKKYLLLCLPFEKCEIIQFFNPRHADTYYDELVSASMGCHLYEMSSSNRASLKAWSTLCILTKKNYNDKKKRIIGVIE